MAESKLIVMTDGAPGFPKRDWVGKFVQVETGGVNYLVFGQGFHVDILVSFLNQQGIVPQADSLSQKAIPSLRGEDYRLFGAGTANRFREEDPVIIYKDSESRDYGVGPHLDLLNKVEGVRVV